MERRKTPDHRKVHMFVSNERRKSPHDRRGTDTRRLQRDREREKIESIRAFKDKDNASSPVAPLITKKRLVYFCLGLLIIVVAVFLIN